MIKIILLILFFVTSVFSAENCLEISEKQMQEWAALKPQTPTLHFLFKAKKLIETERAYSQTLGNDKTAHCYLGCRVNEDINYATAIFIAWQKEYNDATDCDSETYFDIQDYEATVKGAICTTNQCVDYCQKLY